MNSGVGFRVYLRACVVVQTLPRFSGEVWAGTRVIEAPYGVPGRGLRFFGALMSVVSGFRLKKLGFEVRAWGLRVRVDHATCVAVETAVFFWGDANQNPARNPGSGVSGVSWLVCRNSVWEIRVIHNTYHM